MAKKIARVVISLAGAALGPAILIGIHNILISVASIDLTKMFLPGAILTAYIISAIVFFILFIVLSPAIIDGFLKFVHSTETHLTEMPIADVFFGAIGLIIGLLIALLISSLINRIPIVLLDISISAVVYITLGYLGWSIAVKRRSEFFLTGWLKRPSRERHMKNATGIAKPKILDTSVIIDERIFDICKTGIIEGQLIIPAFVLRELRHIADSTDALKRNRGRRGLDILNEMQKELGVAIRIEEKDYDDIDEVDTKLLKLTQEMGGIIVTNDYNLNKVAEVQNVQVFNINELANAVKPVVLPGEEMRVQIIKDGKEAGQGVAYLDDGTMIVIDGGKQYQGKDVDVLITSVLQTSAGKMIFGKVKNNDA